jgi:hypothetical protein
MVEIWDADPTVRLTPADTPSPTAFFICSIDKKKNYHKIVVPSVERKPGPWIMNIREGHAWIIHLKKNGMESYKFSNARKNNLQLMIVKINIQLCRISTSFWKGKNNKSDHVFKYGIHERKQMKVYLLCHISATPYHHALRKEHVRGLYKFIAWLAWYSFTFLKLSHENSIVLSFTSGISGNLIDIKRNYFFAHLS